MTRSGPLRLHALAAGIAITLLPAATAAQDAEWDKAAAEAAPFADRVIAEDALAPLPEEGPAADPTGLPRSLAVQLVASRTERGDERFDERGITTSGFRETATLGTLSFDATLLDSDRYDDRGLAGNATLWQRGLFLDGGWRANHGLGVLNTPLPPLLREQYRFFLPSVPFVGASADWQREGGLHLQGSWGRAGVFEGARVVGFELADGQVGSAGAQWAWAPGWTGAASWLATDGRIVPDEQGEAFFQDGRTRALLFSTAWENARDRVQLNLQDSGGYLGDAVGAWLDARAHRGRYTHQAGAFRLEPGLAWGALPIANDAQGGYYRVAYQHARWTWNAGADLIESVSGNSFDGVYGNGFLRYQASTRLGVGGSLSVRESERETAVAARAFLDRRGDWGLTRLQLDVLEAGEATADSWQVSLDQALPMRTGSRLSVSVAHGEIAYEGRPATRTSSVAAFGGLEFTERLSLDGSARWTRGDGPGAFRGTDLNLNLNWRLAARWWLVASLYENRGRQRSPFQLDPLANPDLFEVIPRDRSLFLALRYERQAGTPQAVLGGPGDGAAGAIAGSVFLDDNGDGERSASEEAAANVTVVLDGRYAVRTDSQGNFLFPRVATGPHVIQVIPDNLPLPWFLDEGQDRRTVEVRVRGETRVDIGARRQR